MPDIDAYIEFKKYLKFQQCRPDYNLAISQSIKFAKKYSDKRNLVVADFCCGTGSNTKLLANTLGSISKSILIDINKGFLEIAKKSNIKSKKVVIYHSDILKADLNKEADIVLSIFAYHHISDKKKLKYISQIKNCLKTNGILILAEIYFENRSQRIKYYDMLYESISKNKRINGLDNFLKQTAKSENFEFKVSKCLADSQFKKLGFTLVKEVKIWPKNSVSNIGTFVQVYRL
jgi:putative AdoMet-dependent methyltransferase